MTIDLKNLTWLFEKWDQLAIDWHQNTAFFLGCNASKTNGFTYKDKEWIINWIDPLSYWTLDDCYWLQWSYVKNIIESPFVSSRRQKGETKRMNLCICWRMSPWLMKTKQKGSKIIKKYFKHWWISVRN